MTTLIRTMPELLEVGRYPFHYRLPTRYADIDPNGHINNVAFAAAFEDARCRFDHAHGVRLIEPKMAVLVAAHYIDYLAEAHYPAPIDLHVGVWTVGRSSWTLASLAMQGDKACAFSRVVLVSVSEGRARGLSDPVRATLETMRVVGVAVPVDGERA